MQPEESQVNISTLTFWLLVCVVPRQPFYLLYPVCSQLHFTTLSCLFPSALISGQKCCFFTLKYQLYAHRLTECSELMNNVPRHNSVCLLWFISCVILWRFWLKQTSLPYQHTADDKVLCFHIVIYQTPDIAVLHNEYWLHYVHLLWTGISQFKWGIFIFNFIYFFFLSSKTGFSNSIVCAILVFICHSNWNIMANMKRLMGWKSAWRFLFCLLLPKVAKKKKLASCFRVFTIYRNAATASRSMDVILHSLTNLLQITILKSLLCFTF